MEKTQYDFQILINLDQEVADLWVGHCLNIDVVSQGATPCAALENTMMATQFLVLDDCAKKYVEQRLRAKATTFCQQCRVDLILAGVRSGNAITANKR